MVLVNEFLEILQILYFTISVKKKKTIIITGSLSATITVIYCTMQVSGLYEYKITGLLEDVGLDVCKQVYMDLEYRKKWDDFVKGELP